MIKIKKGDCFQYFLMVLDHQKALVFRLSFRRFFMFIQNRSPRQFSEGPMQNFYNKLVFGAIFDFQDFQEDTFRALFSRSRPPTIESTELRLATWCRPCFSQNHSNYCAVGTYWLSKGHFSDEDVLNWSLFLFLTCI